MSMLIDQPNIAPLPAGFARGPMPSDGDPDRELAARLRTGEEEAFEILVRRYGTRMATVARRFLRAAEDRADVVQEAFFSAFRAIENFEGNSSLWTWLHRIVVNACLQKLRSRTRRREVSMNDLCSSGDDADRPWGPAVPGYEQALARMARAETGARVRACIDRLAAPYRRVLVLRDLEGRDTDETARLLDLTPAAVKTRLHRARQALRTLLGDDPTAYFSL